MSPLDRRIQAWLRAVVSGRPGANPEYAASICREIVQRANILAGQSYLKRDNVAEFLLDRTLAWVAEGTALDKIGPRLPKSLSDLGALKIAEGGRGGGPLSKAQLKQVKRIIQ